MNYFFQFCLLCLNFFQLSYHHARINKFTKYFVIRLILTGTTAFYIKKHFNFVKHSKWRNLPSTFNNVRLTRIKFLKLSLLQASTHYFCIDHNLESYLFNISVFVIVTAFYYCQLIIFLRNFVMHLQAKSNFCFKVSQSFFYISTSCFQQMLS